MEKFKNKYRIKSHRRPNWDYSANGLYFLTIVTQNRACNLGEIVKADGRPAEMILSDFGKIVECEWFKSFEIRNELILHEFALMPNHIHAMVEIYNENRVDKTVDIPPIVDLPPNPIESELLPIKQNPPIRLPKSISSFIAGFKAAVNTKIDDYIDAHQLAIPKYNKNNHFFQPNYHDHIVRNETEYYTISNYIISNPLNWHNDKLYV